MSDRLLALRLFIRTAHLGSFSRAGRELGLSQPSASRIVAELEREIGATLFLRTTRAVTLTDAGRDYLARVEPLLNALEEADHAARGTGELRGQLRVALSSSFAVREVIPLMPDFMDRHPTLRIDLSMNDLRQDLVVDGVDVALRFGTLVDSTATARLVGTQRRILVASPAYARKFGLPESPADLPNHRIIVGPAGSGPEGWSFEKDDRRLSIRIEGRLTISVNEGAVAAAVSGLGICGTSLWACRQELGRGELIEVLPDWKRESAQVHAVFPAGRAAKPAARAFIDYLTDALSRAN